MKIDTRNRIFYIERQPNEKARKFAEFLSELNAVFVGESIQFNGLEFKPDNILEYCSDLLRKLLDNEYSKDFLDELIQLYYAHPKAGTDNIFQFGIRTGCYPLNCVARFWHVDPPYVDKILSNFLGSGTEFFHPDSIDLKLIPDFVKPLPYDYLEEMKGSVIEAEPFSHLYIANYKKDNSCKVVHRAPQIGSEVMNLETYKLVQNWFSNLGREFNMSDITDLDEYLKRNLPIGKIKPRCLVSVGLVPRAKIEDPETEAYRIGMIKK